MSVFDTFVPRQGTRCDKWDNTSVLHNLDDVLPLWVADTDFAPPQAVLDALKTRLEHPVFGYAWQPAETFTSFCQWAQKRFHWHVQPEEIVFSPGIVPALSATVQALTEPGDAVVIQTPVYPPFFRSVTGNKRRLLENPLLNTQGHYTMDFDHLEHLFRDEKARLMLFCSPHNPVGRVWTPEELGTLAALCEKYEVRVISDDIHADLVFAPHQHLPLCMVSDYMRNNTIVSMAPSKTFNIAGLCASVNVVHNESLRRKLAWQISVMGIATGNVLGLVAMDAAYAHGESWLTEFLAYSGDNFRLLDAFLKENLPETVFRIPEATYLGWLDFRAYPSDDLNNRLLDEGRVKLSDGSAFGAQGHGFQRINVGCTRQTLSLGLSRIASVITSR